MTSAPAPTADRPAPSRHRVAARRAHRPHPGARALGAALATSVVAGALFVGAGAIGAAPAGARDRPAIEHRLHVCDPTGCLIAWKVVDSDHDGVADADEVMAGTDPHDPKSVPGLHLLTDLLAQRQLPSFENGFAAFVVLPDDLVKMQEEATDPGRLDGHFLEGFPLGARKDTLSRLGISADAMAAAGVDPFRTGLTLGLEPPTKVDDGMPAIRVGGVDLSLISADDGGMDELTPLTPLLGGGTKAQGPVDGGYVVLYEDGSAVVILDTGDGVFFDPEGNPILYPKGTFFSNPDADQPTEVTPEAFAQWERVLGATIHTVDGWEKPKPDADFDPARATALISLIDSEMGVSIGITADVPRVTSAQPDVNPNLPNPLEAIPPGGTRGGCPVEGRC